MKKWDWKSGNRLLLENEKVKVVGKAESRMFVLDTSAPVHGCPHCPETSAWQHATRHMMIAKTDANEQPGRVSAGLDALETIEARTLKQTLGDIIAYYVDEPMKAVQFLRVMLWLASRYPCWNDYLCDDA